jgi:hypothetical protein
MLFILVRMDITLTALITNVFKDFLDAVVVIMDEIEMCVNFLLRLYCTYYPKKMFVSFKTRGDQQKGNKQRRLIK